MSSAGKWDYSKGVAEYGEDLTYHLGEVFLKGLDVEDWGCGPGRFRQIHQGGYQGIDGSSVAGADVVEDLSSRKSEPEAIFLRHVLEHNENWRDILRNAVSSFRKRLVVVLFTPIEPADRQLTPHGLRVPDIALNERDLMQLLTQQGLVMRRQIVESKTRYRSETLFYIEKVSWSTPTVTPAVTPVVTVTKPKGPVFPQKTARPKASEWHAATHGGPLPKAPELPGIYHRVEVPFEEGVQHNPCVFVEDGQLKTVVRIMTGDLVTTNFVAEVTPNWTLANCQKISKMVRSGQLEDLRIFHWRGQRWAICATHNGSAWAPITAIRQALLEFDNDAVTRVHVLPSTRHEKNWMPCVENGVLRLVYSTDPLVLADLAETAEGYTVDVPGSAAAGRIRGGSQLIAWHGGYIALVHQVHRPTRLTQPHNSLLGFWAPSDADTSLGVPVVYLHRWALFDHKLSHVRLSAPFFFRKLGIEFACGLTRFGDKLVASFGVADKEAWLVEIEDTTVAMLLRD